MLAQAKPKPKPPATEGGDGEAAAKEAAALPPLAPGQGGGSAGV